MKSSFFNTVILFPLLIAVLPAQTAWDAIHIFDGETGFGTRALSLGGAYTGLADDFSAVYWNPAGLGQMDQAQFYSELSHLKYPNNATYMNESILDRRSYTRFRSFGLVSPVPVAQGSLVFAFGYNRIKDYDENLLFSGFSSVSNQLEFEITAANDVTATYPFDRNVYRQEEVSTEGGLGQWSLAGAVAVSPRILVGATLGLLTGSELYRFTFLQEDQNDIYATYPADFDSYSIEQNLHSDISGITLKIGGLWKVARWVQLGGTVTLPARVEVHETHSQNDRLVFDDGFSDATETSGEWTYRIRTPYVFEGGMAVRTPLFTVSTSLRTRDWSQTRFIVDGKSMNNQDYRDYLAENTILATQYRSVTELHAGAEVPVPFLGLTLRGGIGLVPDPLKTGADASRYRVYGGGLSFRPDPLIQVDLTANVSPRKKTTSDQYTPGGTVESINKVLFQAGLSFRF
ncbi:MAG: OmpP1/FadL family transporter [Fidelibacterota bacterium]